MRIALVHDWLTGMRGGENVLEVLCERYPEAELFTLVHVPGSVSPTIERLPTHTSFIQRLPLVRRYYRHYLPLFPTAIEQFSFDSFDTVVSVSHCCAKSIVRPGLAVSCHNLSSSVRCSCCSVAARSTPTSVGSGSGR